MIKFYRLVLLLALLLFFTSSLSAAPRGYASPVAVSEVAERMMAPQVWVNGEIISRSNSQIATEIAGRLTWVAEVGQKIKAGQTLARIDVTLLQQQLEEQLAIVAREQARLDFLDQEVVRLNSLVKQRNVSQSNLDQTIADRAVARGDLAVAKARTEQVAERLRRSEISAPFSGVVSERLLQSGEWADSGKAVVRLVDVQSKEIRAWVTDQVLPFIKKGDHLNIDISGQHSEAEIHTIVPVGGERSRLYEIRLILPTQDWSVGQSLRVAAPTSQRQQHLSVPRDALVLRRDGSFVYRVKEDNSAEKLAVTTGVAMGEFIQVSGALQVGDQVVINGSERLRPGQQVRIINSTGAGQ